jgi:TolA-binding protein
MKRATTLLLALLALWLAAVPARASDDAQADFKALEKADSEKRWLDALKLAEDFVTAHADDDNAPRAYLIGGRAGQSAKEYARAAELFSAFVQRFPEAPETPAARHSHVLARSSARQLEACIAAIDDNLKALPKDSRVEHWTFLRAECQFRLWRFDEAKKALEAFIKAWPKSSFVRRAQNYLGDIDPPWTLDKNNVVQGYKGKYEGDARLLAAIAKLPEYTKEAFEVLKKSLGVDISGKCDVVFRFADKGASRDGERATTGTIGRKGLPWTVMTFYTEFVVLDEEDFHSRVIHELKHAGFRGLMGQKYLDLPKWIREGLAVYGAGQLPDRMPQILSNYAFGGKDPRTVLDGIADRDADHTTDDYLEDALFFEWLARQDNGTHKFCQRLIKGEDYKAIIADLCKQPFEKVMATAAKYTQEQIEKALGGAYDDYFKLRGDEAKAERGGKDALKKWLESEGLKAYGAWLEKNAKHLCAPLARYRIGKGLNTVGKFEEARKMLAGVRDECDRVSTVCDDAAYQYALSYELAGDEEGAKREFGIFLRDYSWCAYAADAAKKYKAAGPEVPPAEESGED